MKWDMCVKNEFLAILNTLTFEDRHGNQPKKQLELKPMIVLSSTTCYKSLNIMLLGIKMDMFDV